MYPIYVLIALLPPVAMLIVGIWWKVSPVSYTHLDVYKRQTVGCPILIGDGLKGTDDVEVPVVGGEYVEKAKIGRAVMDADVFISLTHFKGHETVSYTHLDVYKRQTALPAPFSWTYWRG